MVERKFTFSQISRDSCVAANYFASLGISRGDKVMLILKRHYHIEPWAESLMADLRRKGIRTAVYSDYGCLRERLEALGFDCSWVDVVADAPALGGLKPCKESALRLCTMMGVDPAETLMVGDRDDTDGESARRCGMRFQMVAL